MGLQAHRHLDREEPVSDFRLIDKRPTQRPHIQSNAELQAYLAGRLAARGKFLDQERERREAERAAWRRGNASRRRFWFWVVVYLMTTAGKAGLGLVLSLALAGAALFLSFREAR
jgi:hypothetical protein